jgi:hypothetical protein
MMFPSSRRHSVVLLLSVLYAWILILIGIAFPITEALRETWQRSHVVGVSIVSAPSATPKLSRCVPKQIFNVYLDLGATLFLVYFQVYHVYLHKRKIKKNPEHVESGPQNGQSNGQLDTVTLRHRSVMGRSSSEIAISNPTLEGIPAMPTSVTGSAVTLTSRKVTRRSETSSIIDDEEEEDIVEEYITIHRGMATISDEVTSFYLRLGVLGRPQYNRRKHFVH